MQNESFKHPEQLLTWIVNQYKQLQLWKQKVVMMNLVMELK